MKASKLEWKQTSTIGCEPWINPTALNSFQFRLFISKFALHVCSTSATIAKNPPISCIIYAVKACNSMNTASIWKRMQATVSNRNRLKAIPSKWKETEMNSSQLKPFISNFSFFQLDFPRMLENPNYGHLWKLTSHDTIECPVYACRRLDIQEFLEHGNL